MAHFTCVGATVEELRGDARRRCARPASTTSSRCAATRRRARTEWTKTEGGLEYSHELVRADPRRLPVRDRRRLLPGDAHPRDRRPRTTCATSRRRSTPASTSSSRRCSSTTRCYFDFVERARAIGIDVPIIPGIMPITQRRADRADHRDVRRDDPGAAARRAARRARDEPEAALDFGVAYATLQCAELLRRRRAGHPLLHAEPLAGDARDPQRAEASAAVGAAARRTSISSASATRGEPSGAS